LLQFQQAGGTEVKAGVVVTAEEETEVEGRSTANVILKFAQLSMHQQQRQQQQHYTQQQPPPRQPRHLR
jgi:hypothetical protein